MHGTMHGIDKTQVPPTGKNPVPCRPAGIIERPGLTARRSSKIGVNPPGTAENKLLTEDLVFTLKSMLTLVLIFAC